MASNNNDPNPTTSSDDARADLTAQLDDLLNTLSNKFAGVSSEIFAKMDEMSRRLDNIEASLKSKEDSSK
ncbi:heat shock factor-binding protein [Niveomyces insectorum RCEF 264]|uniref:Heat shock factor-binding protein n=1 Tax=Niveomyces insectorum RCEF 264 TaxID=1081102 RepID=A0A167TZL1_9HYPO|nr:heat shock factor-binding protein [Niveomyces insectorum RCEF 264]